MNQTTDPFSDENLLSNVEFKSVTEKLNEKLKPQHTEITMPLEREIVKDLDNLNIEEVKEKILGFIDVLYPNKDDIPVNIKSMLLHLSEDDNRYYEIWLNTLGKSLEDQTVNKFSISFINFLREWYYTENIYTQYLGLKKILYYSGWILNILIQFQKTKIYYSHKIYLMVEYYSKLIIQLLKSQHRLMIIIPDECDKYFKIKDDSPLNLNLFVENIIYYLVPIINVEFTEIIYNYHCQLRWGAPSKQNKDIKNEIDELYDYYNNAKYSPNYYLWLNSIELIVSTSNNLMNTKLFDYGVIICKINSRNRFFLKEYYKLLHIKLFLFKIDKYYKLLNIGTNKYIGLGHIIAGIIYFMIFYIKNVMIYEFKINMTLTGLNDKIVDKIVDKNYNLLSFSYIINYKEYNKLCDDMVHKIVTKYIDMDFTSNKNWFDKQIQKYELTPSEKDEVINKLSYILFKYARTNYCFLNPYVNYTRINYKYVDLLNYISTIIKAMY